MAQWLPPPNALLSASTAAHALNYSGTSDGHDKPFCSKARTKIDNFKKSPGRYRQSINPQFFKAISVIDKLSSINSSDKYCGKFSMCFAKFFCKSNCKNVFL